MTVHQSPITVNGWQGSGYSVIDPETGVGAYQISGGASGGAVFGVADVVSLTLSFMEFFLGLGANTPGSSEVMKTFTKVLGTAFQVVGISFGLITSFINLIENCPNESPALIAVLSSALIIIALLGFISFTPQAKLMGFLINSIWSKIYETFINLSLNIVQQDCNK